MNHREYHYFWLLKHFTESSWTMWARVTYLKPFLDTLCTKPAAACTTVLHATRKKLCRRKESSVAFSVSSCPLLTTQDSPNRYAILCISHLLTMLITARNSTEKEERCSVSKESTFSPLTLNSQAVSNNALLIFSRVQRKLFKGYVTSSFAQSSFVQCSCVLMQEPKHKTSNLYTKAAHLPCLQARRIYLQLTRFLHALHTCRTMSQKIMLVVCTAIFSPRLFSSTVDWSQTRWCSPTFADKIYSTSPLLFLPFKRPFYLP